MSASSIARTSSIPGRSSRRSTRLPSPAPKGRYFWDYDGKRYLDFASQLINVSIGHQHPKLVQAIKDQADRLCTIGPPMANDKRSRLARLIAEVTPGDLQRTFFTNGGAEANENAIKLAAGTRDATRSSRATAPTTARPPARSRSPATRAAGPAEPGPPRRRANVRSVHVPLPGGSSRSVPRLHRERRTSRRSSKYEGPHTVAAVIIETVTGRTA